MFSASIVREKEIFENERFSPISGWSSKGLLITDRKAFSNRDGSLSWSSYEQAEENLISYGWEWDAASWAIDTSFPNVDNEGTSYSSKLFKLQLDSLICSKGWSYDVNFGTFESASATKGMMHFVRRRRRVRNQHFTGL